VAWSACLQVASCLCARRFFSACTPALASLPHAARRLCSSPPPPAPPSRAHAAAIEHNIKHYLKKRRGGGDNTCALCHLTARVRACARWLSTDVVEVVGDADHRVALLRRLAEFVGQVALQRCGA
jgi:hypothetical protein